MNIYAPTNLTDQNSFFQSVHQFFIPHSRLIIGGDLNCYDSPHDKYGGNVVVNNELAFKTSFNLIDAWRAKHPRESQFTWFNPDMSIGSRLDSFLISHEISNSLVSCEILPCVYSDHDFLSLDLDVVNVCQIGPGVWKLNNSLLMGSVILRFYLRSY